MKKGYFTKGMIAAAALAATSFGFAAQAGEASSLKAWAKQAGVSVDDVMHYPAIAMRKGEQGTTTLRVTVDREGQVTNADTLASPRSVSIRSAARNVVKRADFPALPAGYEGEELTFALQLTYAIAGSAYEQRMLERDARVTGREVASKRGPVMASIRVLGQADD